MKEKSLASWPPKVGKRTYYEQDKKAYDQALRGRDLPSYQLVDDFNKNPEGVDFADQIQTRINEARIFSNLPKEFMTELFNTQLSEKPIRFPNIREDKSPTVESCLKEQAKFNASCWKKLGWKSESAYRLWLKTPMLFAFAPTAHYCQVRRVFNYEGNEGDIDLFKLQDSSAPEKITNILSVSGFEYRGYKRNIPETYSAVKTNASTTMSVILEAANQIGAQNIVLIPFGMGVFLPENNKIKEALKQHIIEGWLYSLNSYKGAPIRISCCLIPGQFELLSRSLSKECPVELVNHTGSDAYTVANALEDDGKKTLLINAADDDWKVMLKGGPDEHNKVHPGQFGRGHTLYHSTSDEYYSLLTDFAIYSIKNMRKFAKNFTDCLVQVDDDCVNQLVGISGTTIRAYNKLTNADDELETIKTVLKDYTKNNCTINRFFHGHWNRHHVREVNEIVKNIESKTEGYTSPEDVLEKLSLIQNKNMGGSLDKRTRFLNDFHQNLKFK